MEFTDIYAPFASRGDREKIDYEQKDLQVSWLGGYSYLYGLKPDETDLNPYIEREKFNEIMYLTTAKMLAIEKYAQDVNQDLDDTKNDLNNTKDTLADDYVTRSTAQTISGLKTFDSALPRSSKNPTHQDELVRMGYLKSGEAGVIITGDWEIIREPFLKNSRIIARGVWMTNTSRKSWLILTTYSQGNRSHNWNRTQIKNKKGVISEIAYSFSDYDDASFENFCFILNPGYSWRYLSGGITTQRYCIFK